VLEHYNTQAAIKCENVRGCLLRIYIVQCI